MSLVQLLMESHTDMYGEQVNYFHYDLEAAVKDAWEAKYGEAIEETLNISGNDVSNIFALVPPILIRWEFEEDEK